MGLNQGIPYIPLYANFFEDPRIQFITAKYSVKGEAIVTRLLCRIAREGYYTYFDDDNLILFSNHVPECDYTFVKNVIQELLKRKYFDQELYTKYQILTSDEIQKHYFSTVKRRKDVKIVNEYLITADHVTAIVSKKAETVNMFADSAVQEKKEKEVTKVTKVPAETHPLIDFIESNCPNIQKLKTQLTVNNCKTIFERYNKTLVYDVIGAMENTANLHKKYLSVNLTIQNWCKMRVEKNGGNIKQPSSFDQAAFDKRLREEVENIDAGRTTVKQVLALYKGERLKLATEKLHAMGLLT